MLGRKPAIGLTALLKNKYGVGRKDSSGVFCTRAPSGVFARNGWGLIKKGIEMKMTEHIRTFVIVIVGLCVVWITACVTKNLTNPNTIYLEDTKIRSVAETQQQLCDVGYDIDVDGIWGPETEWSFRDWKAKRRYEESVMPETEIIKRLGSLCKDAE